MQIVNFTTISSFSKFNPLKRYLQGMLIKKLLFLDNTHTHTQKKKKKLAWGGKDVELELDAKYNPL